MRTDPRADFVESLGFGLDPFQVAALDAVDEGHNVLVSAPTGSGKTIVATYAVTRTLLSARRAFYTTPLKALSNQKYHEFVNRFGADQVGLLTGDVTINHGAPIVVMTTEVLRNMLLTDVTQLHALGLVVLDEVHFLQDPYRGGVWEEVLILTPPPVRFVALSATIGNVGLLGAWFEEIRGATAIIEESRRPIVLHHHVAYVPRASGSIELAELLDGPRLAPAARRVDGLAASSRKFRRGAGWHGPTRAAPPSPVRPPRRGETLRALEDADLLPAIIFIFSRAGCDAAVAELVREGASFTSAVQARECELLSDLRLTDFTDEELHALDYGPFLEALRRGVAAHHAGMVPAFREIVETCFERGLLGVVFATETLALGVNLPARTVVLERFSKYTDAGRRMLTAADFAQLTGRAGRRGLDDEGHAVVQFAPPTTFADVGRVALAPPGDLHSSFRPTYNFTANLVGHVDRTRALEIVHRSFAQFEALRNPARSRRPLADLLEARLAVLDELDYTDGWELTPAGRLLSALYHENDLLVAESLAAGVLDDLEPALLVGVASALVYQPRPQRHAHTSAHARRRPRGPDRIGGERRALLQERLARLGSLAARVHAAEQRHYLPTSSIPNGAFAPPLIAWARGAPLGVALDVADAAVGPTSPGDFVRTAKQVADLCDQISRIAPAAVAAAARAGSEALVRSVVASTTGVHPGDG